MDSIQEETKEKYTQEDILEMMGGYEYFSYDQVQYVYLKINGYTEEAEFHLDNCLRDAAAMKKKENRMKDENEIKKVGEDREAEAVENNISVIVETQ